MSLVHNTTDPGCSTSSSIATDGTLTYATIDLGAIAHNVSAIKAHVGAAVEVIAVVKANGYGHGAIAAARAALRGGATRLAVARVGEGIELRRAGITAPILVMTYTPPEAADAVIGANLTAAVSDWDVAQALWARANALGRAVTVHLKVDTGMGRFGLLPDEVAPFVSQVMALPPGLDLEGLFTHLAVADEISASSQAYTRQQLATFKAASDAITAAGHRIRLRHAANSAAMMTLPDSYFEAVRPGIAIYGMNPSDEVTAPFTLRPALALKSRVARVRTLPPGSSISYGRTFVTERPTPVALIPAGYGDGYRRLISNRGGAVLIRGRRAPIAGRVCMDAFVVDVSGIAGVQRDDEVVLIGAQGDERITAEEVARWGQTVNYDVTTSILPRVKRIYIP